MFINLRYCVLKVKDKYCFFYLKVYVYNNLYVKLFVVGDRFWKRYFKNISIGIFVYFIV